MTTTFSDFLTALNHMALMPAELQASLESSTLTPSQTEVLRQLALQLVGPQALPHPASSLRSASASLDPWRAFHSCNHLVLDPVYYDILTSGPQHFVDSYRDATVYDGVIDRFPEFSGKRLSDRMKDELQSLFPEEDVIEQYKAGKNLARLCNSLGMGCVLYLANLLSNDFLCNKFTASGRYHDGAIDHLETLHLKEMAEDSGANVFVQKAKALSVIYLKMRTSQF
ncbi:hypothetical protein KCU83_g247, partial [Aureobasidium melanogenum]